MYQYRSGAIRCTLVNVDVENYERLSRDTQRGVIEAPDTA